MAEDDVAFRLLHTADWHLGKRFPAFDEEAQKKLMRARLDVLREVFAAAVSERADAVLCAGDLFDDPTPASAWWSGLLDVLGKLQEPFPPVFLLPGNHDPLVAGSVWRIPEFVAKLPSFVRIVDREDFREEIKPGLTLFAVPCLSKSGANDPVEKIPAREPGDNSIRVGMCHGSTFDCKDIETNFPIRRGGTKKKGLDYLAIGDTHGFRLVEDDPPVVYPGAPEPTAFDEVKPGHVAVVLLSRTARTQVRAKPIRHWAWQKERIESLDRLRDLLREDLIRTVLRLEFDLEVTLAGQDEVESILGKLAGDDASHGLAGVLDADREGLRVGVGAAAAAFPADLAPVLKEAVQRLTQAAADADPLKARRATIALYKLSTLVRGG